MPRISALTALTTVDNADELAIVDVSASVTKKITRAALLSSAPLPNNTVTTAAIADGAVTTAKIADNAVVADKIDQNTILIGFDEQNTTGTVFNTFATIATTTVTIPTGVTKIEVFAELSELRKNAAGTVNAAIFQAGSSIRTDTKYSTVANLQLSFTMRRFVTVTAGSTHTFDLRVNSDSDTGTFTGWRTISVKTAR